MGVGVAESCFKAISFDWQRRSQDFSRGGSVCGNFANHTHFLKTTPIIRKLRATVVAHKRVAS